MNWFYRPDRSPRPYIATASRPQNRARPCLEGLETRLAPANVFLVPPSQPADSTHLHRLGSAIHAAGAGGSVTIEPGAPTAQAGISTSGITIQGDPNVPASSLPSYDLALLASNVTLTNLNLSSLNIPSGTVSGTMVSKCLINALTENGFGSTFSQNTFTGPTTFTGDGTHGNERISNNLFTGNGFALDITSEPGSVVSQNTFLCAIPGPGDPIEAVVVENCGNASLPFTMANNTVTVFDAQANSVGIYVTQTGSGTSNVRLLNNEINMGNQGRAALLMGMAVGDGTHFQAYGEGNDFRSAVGISVSGDGTFAGNLDFGGGASAGKGGNNFRAFTAAATTSSAAILMQNATNGSIFAEQCLFRPGVSPASLVLASSGTAVIDVGKPLSDPRAFVQALYNEVLGRTGNLSELDGWVSLLNTQGQAAVASGILRSTEGLGRIVDAYYLRFLGRQADAGGRSGWIGFLQHGGTEEQLEDLFLTSPEYLSHINTDFVQSLYINILGRTGTASELAGWYSGLQALGLSGIAAAFTGSAENRQSTVTAYYQAFLHRTPAAGEPTPLVNSGLDLLSLEQVLLSSAEFFANG